MGICSFVPDVDYSSYGVNIFNKKLSSSEYFQPEFDNLGKQPLDATALYLAKVPGAGGIQSPAVLGWIPRYAEYKTHIDEVHGQLNGNIFRSASGEPTLSSWTAPRLAGFEDDKASFWCKDGLSKNFFMLILLCTIVSLSISMRDFSLKTNLSVKYPIMFKPFCLCRLAVSL